MFLLLVSGCHHNQSFFCAVIFSQDIIDSTKELNISSAALLFTLYLYLLCECLFLRHFVCVAKCTPDMFKLIHHFPQTCFCHSHQLTHFNSLFMITLLDCGKWRICITAEIQNEKQMSQSGLSWDKLGIFCYYKVEILNVLLFVKIWNSNLPYLKFIQNKASGNSTLTRISPVQLCLRFGKTLTWNRNTSKWLI